ncbi:MAG: efflux RND transporter permease subunit [Planctomycetaceae bacterium]|nr:efflux RND transporter permease subunit [Planctomycetaceae bacterium]
MSLPSFSVRNPVLVNMMMLVVLLAGFLFAMTLQREMFPESRPDKLLVSAIYPGVQPADVEKSVTIKVEEAVRSIEGIEKVESQVGEGISFTTLTLLQSVDDVDALMQEVRNEIDSIQDIPDDVEKISLRKVEPQLPVISIAIYGDVSEMALKEAARNLRDDLLRLPGVSRVNVNGVLNDEIYVDVRPEKLLEYDITFEEVAAAIRRTNLDVSGGQLKGDRSTIAVRTIGEEQQAIQLDDIVILADPRGRRVLLSDVATIFDGFIDSDVDSRFNGKPNVDCVIFKAEAEDVVQISSVVKTYVAARSGQPYTGPPQGLSAALSVIGRPDLYKVYQEFRSQPFPKNVSYQLHTDIARFVEGRLDLMVRNGRAGLVLVLVSLLLFLNWRVAIWVATGLVVSFLGAFVVMWMLGASINLLSMFGLIIVLGIIVDDAIVIGENVYRHVENGMPAAQAAIHGAQEVMWPVIVSVATTIGAFVPLFFIQGQIGDFMGELPLVVIAALSISLLEALVILPAHLRHLPQPRHTAKAPLTESPADAAADARLPFRYRLAGVGSKLQQTMLLRLLQRPYERLLAISLRWRYVSIMCVIAGLVLSFGMLFGGVVRWQFIQDLDSETLICTLEMPIGTTSDRLLEEMQILNEHIVDPDVFPEVVNVQSIAGRQVDITGAGAVGFQDQSHIGMIIVEICPSDQRTKSSKQLVNELRRFCQTNLVGLHSYRWDAMSGGPAGNDLEINIAGLSEEQLPTAINEIKQRIAAIKGVYDLDDNLDIGKKELQLHLRDSAAATGFTVGTVGGHVRAALFGQEARRITRNREDVRIMVRYPEEYREDPWTIETMWLPTSAPRGQRQWVPLHEVAEARSAIGYSTIHRYQQTRSARIVGSVDDAVVPSTTSVIEEIQKIIVAEIAPRYPGIDVQYLGQAEETRKSFSSLMFAFPVAFLLIYGMLAGLFHSYTQPLVVMAAIPFGFIGAVLGHWLLNETFTILSAIGMVALAGILVNDSLVLIDFINKQIDEGQDPLAASIQGGKTRLRAILLTTLTTAAGLLPLMFETSLQAKFLIPMAVTLTFGLLFATVLTLIVVPAINLIRIDLLNLMTPGSPAGRQ